MRTIIMATSNMAKVQNFKDVFGYYGIQCLSLEEAGMPAIQIEENGLTPEENALMKAEAHWQLGLTIFADDAGLEVDALKGEPGVQARRWNGRFSDSIGDEVWLDYLLQRLEGVPQEQRTAKFVSGWALINEQGQRDTYRVLSAFTIASKRIRPMTPGFPLSAVSIDLHKDPQIRIALNIEALTRWPFFMQLV